MIGYLSIVEHCSGWIKVGRQGGGSVSNQGVVQMYKDALEPEKVVEN